MWYLKVGNGFFVKSSIFFGVDENLPWIHRRLGGNSSPNCSNRFSTRPEKHDANVMQNFKNSHQRHAHGQA